jgi:PAS domain S-box-containing protein
VQKLDVDSNIGLEAVWELFEAAPCGYLFTKPDGTIVKVNQTFLEWTGYKRDELAPPKRFQELFTKPCAIFYETHFAPLLRMQGYVKEIALDITCKSGQALPVLINSTVQADEHGNPLVIRTTVFDARERRRYERELLAATRQAELLAAVVNDSSDAIVTMNADLTIKTWNRGAESLFGFTAPEIMGKNLQELIVPNDQRSSANIYLERLRGGEPMHYEAVRQTKNGELIPVDVIVTPRIEPPNEVVAYSAVLRDLREVRRIEQERQTLRDIQMINHLAHEINNPLQAVMNCLTMFDYQTDKAYIETANEQVARAARAVTDLVKLTSIRKTPK